MNLTFLNGAFLFAALAALLPLLIHLISRRRVATVDFSSLRFLKELERKRIRRVRLRQILLLIVRSLIILSAALALARPTLTGTLAGPGRAHARTSVAVVIDDSASMSRSGEGGDLFARAVDLVAEIAGLLGEGDQAFLVTAGEPASAVLVDGTFSPDVLAEAAHDLERGHRATDYTGAIALAEELLLRSRNINRELYVLGDMQRAGWNGSGTGTAGTASAARAASTASEVPRAYLLALSGPTANLGVRSVKVERSYGGTEGLFSISADIDSHGRRSGEVAVKLFVDGEQAGQAGVDVERDGTATARFSVAVDESGWHHGWVELPPDALESDNRCYFIIPRVHRAEVLIVRPDADGEWDDAYYIERALDPTGESERVAASLVTPDALASQDRGRFPVVVLADVGRLSADASSWLRSHVDGGGGLLVILGNRTDIRFWNGEILPDLAGAQIRAPVERGDGVRLAPSVMGHPMMEGLVFGERLIDDISVRRAFEVAAGEVEEVLELPGIGPALFLSRVGGGGEVAVLTTGIDPSWNDLPKSGFIVPLVHRLVDRLERLSSAPASVLVGEDLIVRFESSTAERVGVTLPDGTTATAGTPPAGIPGAVLERAPEAGVYRFAADGRTAALGAVNADPGESNLRPASMSEIEEQVRPMAARFVDPGERLEDEVLEERRGRELWRVFVYVALGLIALEMFLARPRFS